MSTETKFTPGPWAVDGTTILVPRGISPHVAYCRDGTGGGLTDQFEANCLLIAAAPIMHAALEAHHAWALAERVIGGLGTTFDQRSELCSYSEWLTRKALAAVAGVEFTEEYEGVPHLIVWPVCEIQRAPVASVAGLVQAVLAAERVKEAA